MCMFHDTRITHGKPKVLATTVNQGCYSWLFERPCTACVFLKRTSKQWRWISW